MIALIDYGAGNLTSVRKAMAFVGAATFTPPDPADLDRADAIIVPGVGHFQATARLDRPWHAAIRHALDRGIPILGICLGMQWLFEGSDEAADVAGLGILAGRCRRLQPDANGRLKVPHVGWNALTPTGPSRLLVGIENNAFAYFTHSYAVPITPDCVARTKHGDVFASVVERGAVSGVQFHPEKSGDVGIRILRNWLHGVA